MDSAPKPCKSLLWTAPDCSAASSWYSCGVESGPDLFRYMARAEIGGPLKVLAASIRPMSVARKVITFLVLVCFCASSMPLPVGTIRISDKAGSQPFPCQDSPCGCKTAEQCWTNCCCTTPVQRIAWARKNGVTPPQYAIAALSKTARPGKLAMLHDDASNATLSRATEKPSRACCAKHAHRPTFDACQTRKSDCRSARTDQPTKCQAHSQARADMTTGSKHCSQPSKRKIVLSVVALKCQGGSSDFTLLPWMIPATVECMQLSITAGGRVPQAEGPKPLSVDLNLDTPPPKRSPS